MIIALGDLVSKHKETLGTIETWDNGKTYDGSMGDIAKVISVFKYYGNYADKIHGQVIDTAVDKFAYRLSRGIFLIEVRFCNAGYFLVRANRTMPGTGVRKYYCYQSCRAEAIDYPVSG
jgi:hypothetical protein